MEPVVFESEAFNRSMLVFSTDPYFASAMIDARMMRWMVDNARRCIIELSDRWAFVWAIDRKGRSWTPPQLIAFLQDLNDQVPRALASLFPETKYPVLWKR